MIRKLRQRFILVSVFSVTIVLFLLIGIINVMNYKSVVRSADRILVMLTDGGGGFPRQRQSQTDSASNRTRNRFPRNRRNEGFMDRMGRLINGEGEEDSPELRFESRFFSVTLSSDGKVAKTRTDMISAIDSETAAQMGEDIFASGKKVGFVGDYRYRMSGPSDEGTILIVFYDCGRSMDNARSFLLTSIGFSLVCLFLVIILIAIASKAVIRPTADAYEKQRRFITDAGHELKTPLAIINADTDVLEMELGESEDGYVNEWIEDIRKQTARLNELTGNLIYLAKTEEGNRSAFTFVEFPVSDVTAQEAESFRAPAQAAGDQIETEIEPGLSLNGDQKAIRQLIGILLDNAIKYSPKGETILLRLKSSGRNIELGVTNHTRDELTKENMKHLFDRFYRSDESRNSATGGHGIGLSIAKSIVEAHKGKISADSPDGTSMTITAVFPACVLDTKVDSFL